MSAATDATRPGQPRRGQPTPGNGRAAGPRPGCCLTCGRPLTPVRVQACDGYRYQHYDTWRCPAGHPTHDTEEES